MPNCPSCGTELTKVSYPSGSMLNREQWESVRAGDWLCPKCPDNGRGKSKHCYFWNHELPDIGKCEYCEAYDGDRHKSFCTPNYRQARRFEKVLTAWRALKPSLDRVLVGKVNGVVTVEVFLDSQAILRLKELGEVE